MYLIKKNFNDMGKIVYLNDLIMDIEEAQEIVKRLNANVCNKVNYEYEKVPDFRDFVDNKLKLKKIRTTGKTKYTKYHIYEIADEERFIGALQFDYALDCSCRIKFVIENGCFEDKKKYYNCINAIRQNFNYPNLYKKQGLCLAKDIMQTLFIKTHLYLKRSQSYKKGAIK